jgi:hypothetical protein
MFCRQSPSGVVPPFSFVNLIENYFMIYIFTPVNAYECNALQNYVKEPVAVDIK